MIWIYRLLFLPALLVALPYYGLRMWRRGGYAKDFQHRFGRFRDLPPKTTGRKRVWLQAVSVGEVNAVGPLIDELTASGKVEVVLTTTTSTGYALARERYRDRVLATGVFPLDFWLFSRAAWRRIDPDAVILTESELWPEHLHQAGARGIPAYLVNARMSDRSFARYSRVKPMAQGILRQLHFIFAVSETEAQRLLELGAIRERVAPTGNLKFDVAVGAPISNEERGALRRALGFQPDGDREAIVLLGSSTWPGEEEFLLSVQREALDRGLPCRLLLVPRHAERAPEIVRLLEARDLAWHQRSRSKTVSGSVMVHLADTTGELRDLTRAADLAFIGKSLPPNKGGQSPIEAAALGVPTVIGPEMQNFRAVVDSLNHHNAALVAENRDAVKRTLLDLMAAPEKRTRLAEAGPAWHRLNRGSSRRVAARILTDLAKARV